MSRLSHIVAIDLGHGIGVDGDLPWRISSDLRRFKRLTMGNPIVMGWKTHASIGRALPGRRNLVLTASGRDVAEGCESYPSLDAALEALGEVDEVMLIGGGQLYAQTLAHTDRIYLTVVDARVACDTFYPALDMTEWHVLTHRWHAAGPKDDVGHWFFVLERRSKHPQ